MVLGCQPKQQCGAQEDGIDVRNTFTMKKIGFPGFSELKNVGTRGHKE